MAAGTGVNTKKIEGGLARARGKEEKMRRSIEGWHEYGNSAVYVEDGIVVRATCGDSAGSVYRQNKDGSWDNVLPMKWENFRRGWNAEKLVIMP